MTAAPQPKEGKQFVVGDEAFDDFLSIAGVPDDIESRQYLATCLKAGWHSLRAGRRAPSPAQRNKEIERVAKAAKSFQRALDGLSGYASGQLSEAGWRELLASDDHLHGLSLLKKGVKALADVAERAKVATSKHRLQDRPAINALGHAVSFWLRFSTKRISKNEHGDFADFASRFMQAITGEDGHGHGDLISAAVTYWHPIIDARRKLSRKIPVNG